MFIEYSISVRQEFFLPALDTCDRGNL
jgi:hypothetical protein